MSVCCKTDSIAATFPVLACLKQNANIKGTSPCKGGYVTFPQQYIRLTENTNQ